MSLYSEWKNKTPFGALKQHETAELVFPKIGNEDSACLLVRKIDNTKSYRLNGDDKGDSFFFSLSFSETGVYYYLFEVNTSDGVVYYGNGGMGEAKANCEKEWQITVYRQDYKPIEKVFGGIIYHIFVDRFAHDGDEIRPKYGRLKAWGEMVDVQMPHQEYLANDFYGGNLLGIIDKLDYLAELGVTILYLSPIFKAFSNHRYDTGDYHTIDELIGDEKTFDLLLEKAKEKGIGIVLDGVFNHSGSDSIYFNKLNHYPTIGAYQSKESPYYDWYSFESFPDKYHCWWGCTVVPTFRKESKGYQNLIVGDDGVIDKWTKKGILGWRLDVIDELPIFMADMIRDRVKSCNSDAYILGEVWEDATTKVSYGEWRPYFTEAQLDGVMNYPFKQAIIDFVMNSSSSAFEESIMTIVNNYPLPNLLSSMVMLGSHDTRRILNVLSGVNTDGMTPSEKRKIVIGATELKIAKKRLLVASALEYMLPGIPSIYYGDEVGMLGECDPMNRACFPWGKEDMELLSHYRRLGKIRRNNKDAMLSQIEFQKNDDAVIFTRGIGNDCLTIVANTANRYTTYNLTEKSIDLLSGECHKAGKVIVEPIRAFIFKRILD